MSGSDVRPGHDLVGSKTALERYRRAQEALKAAVEVKEAKQRLLSLTYEVEVILGGAASKARSKGGNPEELSSREKQLGRDREEATKLEKELRDANSKEKQAIEDLAKASEELKEATVVPRVEAAKLRFEEHKLRATLSSASIVGIAATSGILLPDHPSYGAVLAFAFLLLFVSTILSLSAMKKTSNYVEGTLISGNADPLAGLRAWLIRHTFTIGLFVFASFVMLNLAF